VKKWPKGMRLRHLTEVPNGVSDVQASNLTCKVSHQPLFTKYYTGVVKIIWFNDHDLK
jgi:hypothetical protein